MRALLAATAAGFLTLSSFTHADFSIDSVGAGFWIEESPYLEIYQETEAGLHPQIMLGTDVVGISVKTDPIYEKYGIGVAPYIGIGGADSEIQGLLGVEFDRSFTVATKRLDAYFRFNVDFDGADFMLGGRYFFDE